MRKLRAILLIKTLVNLLTIKSSILIALVTTLFVFGCKKTNVDEPSPASTLPRVAQTETIANAQALCNTDLAWLKEIIKKGDEDLATKKYGGRYRGKIFLYAYNATPLFFVEMSMGSNLAQGFIFDCSGAYYTLPANVWGYWMSEAKEKGKLVYTNVPY